MKKYIFICLLALVAVGFASCEVYETETYDLTVMQEDWQWDNTTQQFYYHFDLPQLTSNVYNFGNYDIWHEYNPGTTDAYMVQLPESIYKQEMVIDEVTGDTSFVYYTQHIDARVMVGAVEIQLTNSDYFYDAENPESMLFRLQIIHGDR